jgi:hypothetical protein
VLRYQAVARVQVGCAQHGMDPLEWHADGPKTPDDLGYRYLVGAIAPVAGVRVDFRGLQQPDLVVMTEHLHAHVSRAGEVTDGQGRRRRRSGCHDVSLASPTVGGSTLPSSVRGDLVNDPVTST